jgi:sarcosine oxidase subunit gamma
MSFAPAHAFERKDFVRIGLKGPRAAEWLQQRGMVLPALSNTWRALDDHGGLVARLGASEFFIEQQRSVGSEELVRELEVVRDGVYPVLREDRAFVLQGSNVEDVLLQMCNVNFARVSRVDRQLVMTMMIGIAVLVIPQDEAGNDARKANGGCYRIWCDPSYGDYFWSSLQDVMRGSS